MGLQNYAQQACKRACGLLVLAVLLVSSMAQDSSSDTVRVKVVFEGIPQDEFDAKYNTATLVTVASVAGVPNDYVYRIGGPSQPSSSSSSSSGNSTGPSMLVGNTITPTSSSEQAVPTTPEVVASSNNIVATAAPTPAFVEASSNAQVVPAAATAPATSTDPTTPTTTPTTPSSSSSSGRRLSQVRATAEYGIKTNRTAGDWATPEVIRRKVLSSAAGFGQSSSQGNGKGFYATLFKNGVKAEPMVFLDSTQILAGGLTTEAPKSRFGARKDAELKVLDHQEVKAALNPNTNASNTVNAKEMTPLPAPQPAAQPQPQRQPALQPWAIGLIAVAGVLVLAAGSVCVWRKCTSDAMRKSGSRQQFLPSTVADTSA
uniref:Uncharacterized protein n=1 Tax=Tetradesmus obliquus TaxID=3088 RepID=A0A383VZU1_TETOB|eukprot:jgi/Sobl393_1/12135/SZX70958.1